jgi:hypothetical protein
MVSVPETTPPAADNAPRLVSGTSQIEDRSTFRTPTRSAASSAIVVVRASAPAAGHAWRDLMSRNPGKDAGTETSPAGSLGATVRAHPAVTETVMELKHLATKVLRQL